MRQAVPVVLYARKPESALVSAAACDHGSAMEALSAHLVAGGLGSCASVSGPRGAPVSADRLAPLRVAAIWLLRGTYSGAPTFGPVTRTPVHVLGASHFAFGEDGRVLREFRVVDELAILTQIVAARRAAGQEAA